jgi:competence protein ComEC
VAQALGILLADRGLLRVDAALVAGATAIALGATVARRAPARAGLAGVAAVAAGALALGDQLEAATAWRPRAPLEVTLEGTVQGSGAGEGWTLVDLTEVVAAEPGAPQLPRRVRIFGRPTPVEMPALEAALPGERVLARVRLRAHRELRNPGSHPRARSLERAGIGAVGWLVHPALHVRLPEREGIRPLARLHARRAALAERLSASGPGGGLLRALALGDRRDLPQEARDAFMRLGLAHLLAVSGLHLTLVASLVFAGVRAALARSAWLAARRDTRELALAAGVAAAVLYALAAGWGVPVRRSLVLLLGLAASVARGRPGVRMQPLAAAAIAVLCVEPEALFQAGAQLSFAASAALAMAARAPAEAQRDRSSRLRRAASEGLRTSASAVAATAPLAAYHLGNTAPLGLIANLVGIPWTAFALLPAALAGAVAACFPADSPAKWVLDLSERIAAFTLFAVGSAAARAPALGATVRPAPVWFAVAGALVLLVLWTPRTLVRAALALAVSLLLALAPPAKLLPEPPRIVALDVGQGDATLVQGRRSSVLIDAGLAIPGGVDLGLRSVVPALAVLGLRRLDLVVATHADADHRGGLPAVLEALAVGALWLPSGSRQEAGFAPVLEAAHARGVPVLERGAGDAPARLADLVVTPLWPPRGGGTSRNARSLVVRVDLPGRRVLLPGDIERETEAALLASGADLRADVLKLPHHGSDSSSSAALLRAVGAEVAVASAPCWGRFGMPHAEVLRRAEAAQLSVWWTGRDGAVMIALGQPLAVWGFGEARAGPSSSCRAER